MKLNRVVVLMTCTGLAAACGVDLTRSVDETTAALETVQTDYCTVRAAADQCRAGYDACVLAAGADTEACRQALHDCLPRPPDRRGEGGPGGRCEGMGDGGAPPPPPLLPDGGRPPPHGPGPGPGDRHGGGHRGGISPDPAAVDACRTALASCLAASPGDATCLDAERACIKAAFQAAFDAACADAAAGCANLPADAPSDACTRLQQRCAEGPGGRHDVDGGVCAGE
jgi:hypothetical protein